MALGSTGFLPSVLPAFLTEVYISNEMLLLTGDVHVSQASTGCSARYSCCAWQKNCRVSVPGSYRHFLECPLHMSEFCLVCSPVHGCHVVLRTRRITTWSLPTSTSSAVIRTVPGIVVLKRFLVFAEYSLRGITSP